MRTRILAPLAASGPLVVIYASLLHMVWAGLIWYDTSALGSTTLYNIGDMFGETLTPWLCLVVSVGALAALWDKSVLRRFLLMIPQQFLLVVSTIGALTAIITSSYADGEVRPMAFIAADQMWSLVATLCYSVAVVFTASEIHKKL